MFNTKTQPPKKPPTLTSLTTLDPIAELTAAASNAMTVDQLALIFELVLDQIFPYQGFMLLTHQGIVLQSSPYAQKLCQAMEHQERSQGNQSRGLEEQLPVEIRELIRCLQESRQLFPEHRIQLQDLVVLRDNSRIRLEANWIDLEQPQPTGIVIRFENLTQIAHQQALTDACRYHLTEREREVWECVLLGMSYTQIGQELFISINTVKRHMKSIYRKQEA
ncbi:MAG: LuxR C-terminal-related transcriptional regulator [Cyanobacteria bacterium P01_C01_bin.120]